MQKIVFGPVPSRRLGQSLGINNIPPKNCTYSCVYCQVGRTMNMQIERREFYLPENVISEVVKKSNKSIKIGEKIDYLTFVSDGEPTLDINLKHEIESLKSMSIPIAVISNSSLICQKSVQTDLLHADWVSLKMDAVDETIWRRVNRPAKKIKLKEILEGAVSFSRKFEGKLVTETMLVAGVNDSEKSLRQVAKYLAQLRPAISYISIPTRPPAERKVQLPQEDVINRAYQILSKTVGHVEYLVGYEGDTFAATGNAQEDILSITAVHPMRQQAVDALLKREGADWGIVHQMVEKQEIIEVRYGEHMYYMRKFK